MGPRGFEPLTYGFEDRYDIHFTKDPLLAESIGVEPIHPLLNDRLATCCLAARPTLRNIGGSGEIRTHDTVARMSA